VRKIVFSLGISLDGYFEGPNREIDWHQVDDELHAHFNERFLSSGALLTGRVTHELMAEHWPTAGQSPDSSPEEVEFARFWRDVPKFVFSRTYDRTDWNTTVVREVDVDHIRALKEQPGGDMVVGGPDLADTFRRLGLIDEYTVYVHPVLLGRGRPMFREADTLASLRLVGTQTFGNGVVLLRYRPA
jgi:dihydrofolate reductase